MCTEVVIVTQDRGKSNAAVGERTGDEFGHTDAVGFLGENKMNSFASPPGEVELMNTELRERRQLASRHRGAHLKSQHSGRSRRIESGDLAQQVKALWMQVY